MFTSILGGLFIIAFAVGFFYTAHNILHKTFKRPVYKYVFLAMITLLPVLGVAIYWFVCIKKKEWVI